MSFLGEGGQRPEGVSEGYATHANFLSRRVSASIYLRIRMHLASVD